MTDEEIRKRLGVSDDYEISDFQRHVMKVMEDYEREYEGIPWEPFAYYSEAGDMLKAYWSQNGDYGKWHDPYLTTHHDFETNKLVGFAVHGMRRLIEVGQNEPREGKPWLFYSPNYDSVQFYMMGSEFLARDNFFVKEHLPGGITLFKDESGEIVGAQVINIKRYLNDAC